MSLPATKSPYAGYRFPPEVISQAVWLYFRFPLMLRDNQNLCSATISDTSMSSIALPE
jgi:putative transposase